MAGRLRARALSILLLCILFALPTLGLPASVPAAPSGSPELQAYCDGQNTSTIGDLVFNTLYQRDIAISCAPAGAKVTKVEVTVNLRHDCSAQFNIRLDNSHHSTFLQTGVCPGGYGSPQLSFTTTAFNGDPVNDTWELYLRDRCAECGGGFSSWSIRVHYETATRTPTATYTRPPVTKTPTPTSTRPQSTRTPTATPKPGCDYVSADFDWTTFCAISFTFADRSTSLGGDPIQSWQWDFGDGATSGQQNPAHTYSTLGAFDVTLTVRTQNGCQASIAKQVEAVYPEWVLHKELVSPAGRPVYVGDEVTYRLVVGAIPPNAIHEHYFYDLYDTRYFEFVSASPPPDYVKPAYSSSMLVVWEKQGSIPAGGEREYFVTLRVKDEIGLPIHEYKCNQAWALLTFAANDCGYSVYTPACVEAGPRPSGLVLDKRSVSHPGGVAALGDIVVYEIRVRNEGIDPVKLPSLTDRFASDDYQFIESSPPPDVSKPVGSEWVLIWQDLFIPPGEMLEFTVALRTLRPTQQALNCASFPLPPADEPSPPGIATLAVAIDCASVAVRPMEGKHVNVSKRFTLPSNHIARVGDWLAFETEWRNVGTETANRLDLHDHIVPPAVSKFLPLDFGFLWPFKTGDWAKITASFKAEAPGWPAVNTARWTATWADGSKETTAVQDFVYIAEDDVVPRGLVVRKVLADPLGGAVPGDIVTFRMMVTNITGLTLPVVTLHDTFDPQCFVFHDASRPPDSITPSQVTWNNVGPLGPGDTVIVHLQLRATAPCGLTRNCVRAQAPIPDGPTLVGVDCAPVELKGPELPRLSLVKRRSQPGPVAVESIFDWHLVLENTGGALMSEIPLEDHYDPIHLRFISASPPPDAHDASNGILKWTDLGLLQPGQQHMVMVRFQAIRPGVQVRNCGYSRYLLGSTVMPLVACDVVDIEAPGPAIEVRKVLQYPPVVLPGTVSGAQGLAIMTNGALPTVGLGSTLVYTVSVRNTGGQPLHAVNVVDHFDPDCLEFLAAPGMTTSRPQLNVLAWFIPLLDPGQERSWSVIFRAKAPCLPARNCVTTAGRDPAGVIVEDEACIDIHIAPPEPAISVRKNLQRQESLPGMGDVLVFEVVVQNTGNTTLPIVPLWDVYDRDCLELVDALPKYDWHNAQVGQVHWGNLGPLLPGEARVVHVLMRAIAHCWPVTNCAWSRAEDVNQIEVLAEDCAPAWIRAVPEGGYRLFLPIMAREYQRAR